MWDLLYFVVGFLFFNWLFRFAHFKVIKLKRIKRLNREMRRYKYQAAAIMVVIVAYPVFRYLLQFGNRDMSLDPEQWGQMGDFFGGMLNPILAFASFIALLYTIRLQSKSQDEFIQNSKNDRKMSVIGPEYHRLADSILDDLKNADGLLDGALIEALSGALFKDFGKQPKTIDGIAKEFARLNSELDDDLKTKYLTYMNVVSRISRRFARIENLLNEIQSLAGLDLLFQEGYSRVAQHLLLHYIMSSQIYLSNHSATALPLRDYKGAIREQLDKYLESIGCSPLDTPQN